MTDLEVHLAKGVVPLFEEIKRLRDELSELRETLLVRVPEIVMAKDTTIARVTEAAWTLAHKHHEWGHLGTRMATPIEECEIETCAMFVKALAPTEPAPPPTQP